MMTRVALFLVLVVATGCNYERLKGKREPLSENETWFQFLHRTVLAPKCVTCHHPGKLGGGFDFTSYAALRATGAVTPKDPQNSPLFLSVRAGRMPKGGPKLPDDQIEMIQEWIAAGAEESAPRPKPEDPKPPTTPTLPPPPPPPALEAKYSSIYSLIIKGRCLGCHSGPEPSADLNLSTYHKMMQAPGVVVAGEPLESTLYRQVADGKMPPPPDPKLTDAEISVIEHWIKEGAKEN